MREIIETHGGTVEKYIGDAVMAVFGVPVVHDDDADRGVRAAFACRAALADLNDNERFPLSLRIGVNTGEAVADISAPEQFLVTGLVVSLSARLQQAAGPSEILIGDLTRRLTESSVRYASRRPIDAKGVDVMHASAALALTSPTPEQHRGVPGLRAALVGREHELRLLHDAFDRVVSTSTPSLVTIYGSAGAGKSRLLSEFAQQVPQRVAFGRCLPYGIGVNLYALRQLIRSELSIAPSDARDEARGKLRAHLSDLFSEPSDRDPLISRLSVLLGFDEPGDALSGLDTSSLADELRWALRRYIERTTRDSPCLWVFEDLHWADGALLDLIEDVAERADARLLIVGLARPEFREVRPGWGQHVPNASSLTLAPLTPADVDRLIADLLAIDDLPSDVRVEITARADGNPLYVEEFIRMLIDDGRIIKRDGRWQSVSTRITLDLPPTLLGVISARLDRVAPTLKRLLQSASLAGRLVSTEALAAIDGGVVPTDDLFRDALRRDLLVETSERAPGSGRVFRFKHALIRDVAYGTIPKSQRIALHDNYGRWLERTVGDRQREYSELIAYHAERAYELAMELSRSEAREHGERALRLLLAAARSADERVDQAALGLYERASAIAKYLAADEHLIADLVTRTAVLRFQFGDTGGLDDARRLCERIPDVPSYPELLNALANFAAHDDRIADATELWVEGVEAARVFGHDAVAAALERQADGLYQIGDPNWVRAAHEADEFIRLHAPADSVSRFRIQNMLQLAEERTGDYTAALRRVVDREAIASALGSQRLQAIALTKRARFYRDTGERELSRRTAEAAVRATRSAKFPLHIANALWTLGDTEFDARDWSAALAAYTEALELRQLLGHRGQIPEMAARAARCLVRQARLADAGAMVELAERALLSNDPESRHMLMIARAEVEAAEGEPQRASTLLEEAINTVVANGAGDQAAKARIAYAKFLLEQRRVMEARDQLHRARTFFKDPLARPMLEQIDALMESAAITSVD